MGRILDDVAREERERGEERPQFLQSGVYVGLSKRSAVCRRFARDPRLLDVMEAVIGPNILFWSDKVVFKSEETDYGTPFTSSVWHENVFATQFHPEKSQEVGLAMLRNFAAL